MLARRSAIPGYGLRRNERIFVWHGRGPASGKMDRYELEAYAPAPVAEQQRARHFQPSFLLEVVAVTCLAAVFAALFFAGIDVEARWLAGAGGVGFVALVVSFISYRLSHGDADFVIDRFFWPEDEEEYEDPRVIRVNPASGDGRDLAMPRPISVVAPDGQEFTFTGRQFNQLVLWHERGEDGGGIRRDTSPSGKGFDQLLPPIMSGQYSLASHVLLACGYVRSAGAQLVWTSKAGEFFDLA